MSKELLGKVLAYYEGRSPYDFWRTIHNEQERENAAFDAWEELVFEIKNELREKGE